MSKSYSKKLTETGEGGRTRGNQKALNEILKQVVRDKKLGVVVDWWKQLEQRPENNRGMREDGRHYRSAASLAFYNLFLNSVFDHNPDWPAV